MLPPLPQPRLSVHNGASALTAALHSLDPALSYARVMAACGGVARIVACNRECLCAERHAAVSWLREAAVPGFRLRWVRVDDTARDVLRRRIDGALAAGKSVAWFRADYEGVLTATTSRSRRYAACIVGLEGEGSIGVPVCPPYAWD